jgi:hypothetical protein
MVNLICYEQWHAPTPTQGSTTDEISRLADLVTL